MDEEKYSRIKGFEKLYLISNHGRVISLHKKVPTEKKQLKQHNGYLVVHLWDKQKRIKKRVNRLVAEHFLLNSDPIIKLEVHHKDEDKSNNYFENLEWCTHHQNLDWYHY